MEYLQNDPTLLIKLHFRISVTNSSLKLVSQKQIFVFVFNEFPMTINFKTYAHCRAVFSGISPQSVETEYARCVQIPKLFILEFLREEKNN